MSHHFITCKGLAIRVFRVPTFWNNPFKIPSIFQINLLETSFFTPKSLLWLKVIEERFGSTPLKSYLNVWVLSVCVPDLYLTRGFRQYRNGLLLLLVYTVCLAYSVYFKGHPCWCLMVLLPQNQTYFLIFLSEIPCLAWKMWVFSMSYNLL